MKALIILVFLSSFIIQDHNPVSWKFKYISTGPDSGTIEITGKIKSKWYVYASKLAVEGPEPTSLELSTGANADGSLTSVNQKTKDDEIWGGKISYFENNAKLTQNVKINSKSKIEGKLKGQACSNSEGICVPFQVPFSINL